jgi:aminoglycoside phosphotransferase (APT) family kinase protein
MTDGDPDGMVDPDAGADPDTEADTDARADPDTEADTDARADPDTDARAGPGAESDHDEGASASTGADLDIGALGDYLAAELDVDVVGTEVVHDGVNLSIVVATESDDAAYVVQRPNQLRELETFNDLPVEYGVLERLQSTAVPAPDPVLVNEDAAIIGDAFLVMTHLEGESVPLGSRLPERFRTPAARERYAHELVDTLADLHMLEIDPFAEVCDRRPITRHVDRIMGQFEDAIAASGHEPVGFRRVADWLQENVPETDRRALVHGDYRPSNVLVTGTDRPAVAGVLDWETAFLGDPLTELGYLLLRWRDEGDPTPAIEPLVARYGESDAIDQLRERNEQGLAPFTNEPGSPTRRDLVDRYEAATGTAFEADRFYRAFAAFTLAAVWSMLHQRRTGSDGPSWMEPNVDYLLALAESTIDGEFSL